MRDKSYYRKMRKKHIQRKKRIAQFYYGLGYYQEDGKYSKNKIHCSCNMCGGRDCNGRHIKTRQEIKFEDKYNDYLKD